MSSTTHSSVNRCFTKEIPGYRFRNLLASTALTGVFLASPALSVEYKFGEVSGAVDTIL